LTETIGPVSRTLLAKEKIDRWFFIRYADPHQHLRWRLHVPSGTRLAGVQRRVERAAAALIEDGRVHRVVFDTYEREVERYGGGAGMELVEQYFCADSEAIVELLASLDGADAAGDRRWHAAIPGVNMLLADLGLDLDARLMLMRTLRERFGREFRADAAFGRQLAARFRRSRAELDRLLVMDESPPDDLRIGPFARRSTRARPALDGLRAANDEGRLTWTLAGLAESLVHMHLNRLFRSEQRAHELVIYDFLACLYEARVARGRSGTR
jgi:thiopeptide-type bacteriocin biosynthesis protein